MDEHRQFCERLQRTWLALLLEANMRELAALVVDAELWIMSDNRGGDYGISVDLPPTAVTYVDTDGKARQILESILKIAAKGRLSDQNGNGIDDFKIEFRVKLLDVEDDWRAVVKELIVNAKNANQGVVTEKVFTRAKKQVLTYNEMKFASQSEIRIAQEFERRKVLFFPLPLAVRNDTGDFYKDHREVDFLVCHEGAWGVLEVAFHPDRYEQDAEKDIWFKKSGASITASATSSLVGRRPESLKAICICYLYVFSSTRGGWGGRGHDQGRNQACCVSSITHPSAVTTNLLKWSMSF